MYKADYTNFSDVNLSACLTCVRNQHRRHGVESVVVGVVPEPGVVAPPEERVVVQLFQGRHPIRGEAVQLEGLGPELVLSQEAVVLPEGVHQDPLPRRAPIDKGDEISPLLVLPDVLVRLGRDELPLGREGLGVFLGVKVQDRVHDERTLELQALVQKVGLQELPNEL